MTETVEAPVCTWPLDPPHWSVIIQMHPDDPPWCLAHDDTYLPALTDRGVSACTVCGKTCRTWLGEDCVHPEHRRDLMLRRIPRQAKGAYATWQQTAS